jgi:hypothetical protein
LLTVLGQLSNCISGRFADISIPTAEHFNNMRNARLQSIMEDSYRGMLNGTNDQRGYLQYSASFPIVSAADMQIFPSLLSILELRNTAGANCQMNEINARGTCNGRPASRIHQQQTCVQDEVHKVS